MVISMTTLDMTDDSGKWIDQAIATCFITRSRVFERRSKEWVCKLCAKCFGFNCRRIITCAPTAGLSFPWRLGRPGPGRCRARQHGLVSAAATLNRREQYGRCDLHQRRDNDGVRSVAVSPSRTAITTPMPPDVFVRREIYRITDAAPRPSE